MAQCTSTTASNLISLLLYRDSLSRFKKLTRSTFDNSHFFDIMHQHYQTIFKVTFVIATRVAQLALMDGGSPLCTVLDCFSPVSHAPEVIIDQVYPLQRSSTCRSLHTHTHTHTHTCSRAVDSTTVQEEDTLRMT